MLLDCTSNFCLIHRSELFIALALDIIHNVRNKYDHLVLISFEKLLSLSSSPSGFLKSPFLTIKAVFDVVFLDANDTRTYLLSTGSYKLP